MEPVRVFISYAWEDDAYRFWVRRLATTLRRDGVDARLDAWHLKTGQDFPSFMNAEVRNADRILVLGTPQYRNKVHAFEEMTSTTGVGWEAMLLTAQFFEGNRQKIAVAVARGDREHSLPDFLLTQAAYDLSAPENSNGYRELLKDLRGARPKAPPLGRPERFDADEVTPLFEAPSGMELTLELRDWINARWPEGKPDAIYPPWSEFEADKVTFPEDMTASVEASLEHSACALIVGISASGKSVLGASVAFKWSRVTGCRAFWLDFGDHAGLVPDEVRKDIRRFLWLSGANLLVLDNAQVAPAIADWAVDQVEAADKVHPFQRRLLILTRPLQARENQANLQDRLASAQTLLIPNAALFAAVAVRLLGRHGIIPNWVEADYEQWTHEFGGDLICFGQAVRGAGKAGKPTRAMASKRVREAYIDPALQRDWGVTILERLCAAATLDLTLADRALELQVQQAVPHLVEGGQVHALERGPYRHWKLAHPGMGSLILETRARDEGCDEGTLRRAALLDAVRSDPYMLGPVLTRLANSTYGDEVELNNWSRSLKAKPGILEEFLYAAPTYAVEVDRRIANHIPWHLLQIASPRARMVASLRRHPPHLVASFLRYAERHEPEAAGALLRALLQDGDFRAPFGRTSPEHVTTFLRYAESHESKAARALLQALLQDGDFRALLARTPPHFVASFLRYAERHELEAVRALLRALLQEDDSRGPFGRTWPEDVASFLRYAEGHEPEASGALLRALLQDGDFRALLARTPPHSVASFLRYAEGHEPEASGALLLALFQDDDFRALLARTPPGDATRFFEYAERTEPAAAHALLLDLLAAPEFTRTATAADAGNLAGFALFAWERAGRAVSSWLHAVLTLPEAGLMIRAATPTDLTALARAVQTTSEDSAPELAGQLLRDWWSAWARDSCPDGFQLVACGPILRLAHDLVPELADELVSWLNSLGDDFVEALRPIPLIPRLGLALALRDTQRWLDPSLWETLSRPD